MFLSLNESKSEPDLLCNLGAVCLQLLDHAVDLLFAEFFQVGFLLNPIRVGGDGDGQAVLALSDSNAGGGLADCLVVVGDVVPIVKCYST